MQSGRGMKRPQEDHSGNSQAKWQKSINYDKNRGQKAAPSASVDPLASLENILTGMTSNPQATIIQLGPGVVEKAQALLSTLTNRKRGAVNSLNLFAPSTHTNAQVPSYYTSSHLHETDRPALPEIPPGPLFTAPFIHKSVTGSDRTASKNQQTQILDYERLEFLGDAYLEAIASRLLFSRYQHVPPGRQSQMRERLVKNETLCTFARAYGFQDRLQTTENERRAALSAGNKGLNKILADVFEAYIAAIVLSDPERGFERTEQWLTHLWAPILLSEYGPDCRPDSSLANAYDPQAKNTLQSRLGVGSWVDADGATHSTKIEYHEEKPMEQTTKALQTFFVGAYLTGLGFDREHIGSGKGLNKVEAGNRAAMDAMSRNAALVGEAEKRFLVLKAKRDAERETRKAKGSEKHRNGAGDRT